MIWLGIHFPFLGLEIFRRRSIADGHTAGQASDAVRAASGPPTVLAEDNRVLMADAGALDAGIRLGSSLATAHSLSRDLVHFTRDPEAERRRLVYLAEAAYRYTGHVSVQDRDGLVLEVGASLRLFGGLRAIEARLGRLYADLEHVARMACAHTPLAASVLARAGRTPAAPTLSEFPEAGEIERRSLEALARVPVAGCGLPERSIERLANMGIHHLGRLMALPGAELAKRFGAELTDYLARLSGARADPREPIVPRERFDTAVHLLESVSSKETLLFPMRRLTVELAGWLDARQLGAERVRWRFEPLGGVPAALEVKFAGPRHDARGLLEVSKLALESAALPREVMSVRLEARRVRPFAVRPSDLFGCVDVERNRPMELVDALTARLGEAFLQGIRLTDDHRPEHAWAPADLGPGASRGSRAGIEGGRTPGTRPLWLLEPPRPTDPERYEIVSGPERIETGWWQSGVSRDYYVARDRRGAQCWLYAETHAAAEAVEARSWFLHGYFS